MVKPQKTIHKSHRSHKARLENMKIINAKKDTHVELHDIHTKMKKLMDEITRVLLSRMAKIQKGGFEPKLDSLGLVWILARRYDPSGTRRAGRGIPSKQSLPCKARISSVTPARVPTMVQRERVAIHTKIPVC